jgi:hypothetical protein
MTAEREPDQPMFYTEKEMALRYRTSRQNIARLRKSGRLPFTAVGRRYVYPADLIDLLLAPRYASRPPVGKGVSDAA